MMNIDDIKKLIEQQLPGCIAQIASDDGRHFSAIVVSEEFVGKNKVEQQRLVYKALGNAITSGNIHALTLKTFTPSDWANQL